MTSVIEVVCFFAVYIYNFCDIEDPRDVKRFFSFDIPFFDFNLTV